MKVYLSILVCFLSVAMCYPSTAEDTGAMDSPEQQWTPSDSVIQKVEQLRRIYDDEVDDMELMVAIYSERLLHGAWVGPTLFCIMVENLVNWRRSDRFFFENGYSHTALTLPQLNEVRSTSVARLLCDNGDGVEEIRPKALLNIGNMNKIIPRKQIPGIDLKKWLDPKCYPAKKDPYDYSVKKDQYEYLSGNDESNYSVKKDQDDYPARKDQYDHTVREDQYHNFDLRTNNYNPLWDGNGYGYKKKYNYYNYDL